MTRAARGALGALLVVCACDSDPGGGSATAASPTPWSLAKTPPGKFSMGMEEARKPEPFTLEQRLLDAVSRADRATIERALARGARLDAKDDLGRSVVLLAVLDAGDLDLARWLHDRGAALDEPDAGGRTALSFAAEKGRLDLVRYLIENGAEVDHADVQKRTPLFHAALGDHPEVIGFLLDRKAGVNTRDQFGDTPLIVACAKGNGSTAALLLARGADAALQDQEGRTARERAAPGTAPCLEAVEAK